MEAAFRQLPAWAQALLLACTSASAMAASVTFSGTFDSFTPGPGYGADAAGVEVLPAGLPSPPFPAAGTAFTGGMGGTLLDVVFTPVFTSFLSVTLPAAGASVSGVIGTVQLRERYIDAAETDGLEAVANFTFAAPVVGPYSLSAVGVATVGPVPPAAPLGEPAGAVDLTITWAPMQVAFGDGGLFELTLAPLSFDTVLLPPPLGTGDLTFTLDQRATLTLLAVPEPTSVLLFVVGLVAVGFASRRRCR